MLKQEITRLTERLVNADHIIKKVEKIIYVKENASATLEDKQIASTLSAEVLREVFDNGFDYAIPGEFLDSELGKILFRMKYDVGEKEFNLSEAGEIVGVSRQRIGQLVKEGKLDHKVERNKKVIGYSDLMKFINIHTSHTTDDADAIIKKIEARRK